MRPVIGITPDYEERTEEREGRYLLGERYAAAVEKAGGIPLILPYISGEREIARFVGGIDGLIVTGGAFDIAPVHYGEVWVVEKGEVKDRRTRFEMKIARRALDEGLPFLGICGGEQLLNVLCRGTLYQDILEQVEGAMNHERKKMKDPLHSVEIVPGTLLSKIMGTKKLRVNSSHHQAVRKIGERLIVNARSEDGVIEGVESTEHCFVLGVQWHPEALFEREPACRKIFEALMEASAEGRRENPVFIGEDL